MKSLSIVMGLIGVAIFSYRCNAQIPDDPFSDYLQRSVTISLGAGNAKDVNAAIHTVDPWPPYVGYTRIPGRGRRATDSIERMYRVPNPFSRQDAGLGGSPGPAATGPGPGAGTGTVNLGFGPPTPLQPQSGD
jgi:hypothetical protein